MGLNSDVMKSVKVNVFFNAVTGESVVVRNQKHEHADIPSTITYWNMPSKLFILQWEHSHAGLDRIGFGVPCFHKDSRDPETDFLRPAVLMLQHSGHVHAACWLNGHTANVWGRRYQVRDENSWFTN
jgi:hypothetical protein